ncbi:MAG TPA: protein-L-isoaspartate(D-aspartate) O-methyltransferase [Kofleriaceae bacterium]|nr:protein-L-isoaspartate(D-aspartate) O-methyltransferase [Kofleriaceae bacterium]
MGDERQPPAGATGATGGAGAASERADERARMVREQLEREVVDPRVLAAMRAVPRHRFVPADLQDQAYDDGPLPIGRGQTISQPFVVAVMTEQARVGPGERVLEIGTGSGYQTAVLAALGAEVWSIEIDGVLASVAATVLRELGLGEERVHLRVGDGWSGWPEAAPFAAIVVTAAPPTVPPALVAQLAPGGRLVIPVGGQEQALRVITRGSDGAATERTVFPVRFVPMTGEAQRR